MTILAVDVHYDEPRDVACTAGIAFPNWTDEHAVWQRQSICTGLRPYQAGRFYRRELPCVLSFLDEHCEDVDLATIVIDGYVDVAVGRPGLGRRLFWALAERIAVVGVAKNRLPSAVAVELRRGRSQRPLFVTATGDAEKAAEHVSSMQGECRIPALLRTVDHLARSGARADVTKGRSR